MSDPAKILITRLSSIGDIILTSPVIRTVRNKYPNAHITFVVKKEFASLVNANPHIDKIIEFDKKGGFSALVQLRREIANEQYDWMIDLHNNLRTNFIRRFNHIPEISTYRKQTFRRILLIRFGKNALKEAKPVYLKYFDALKRKQVTYDNRGTEIFIPDEIVNKVKIMLSRDGIGEHQPICVICPGASFSNKQWLPERFGAVADQLASGKGFRIIFLGGGKDQDLCQQIIDRMDHPALNYAGKLALTESGALLRQAKLVITNDSGMMHMAQSQGSPVVAIFGPTTKEMGFFPIPIRSKVVEKEVSCRPCTTKGLNYCPKKHFNCMNLIEEQDVWKAAKDLLG